MDNIDIKSIPIRFGIMIASNFKLPRSLLPSAIIVSTDVFFYSTPSTEGKGSSRR